MKEYMCPNCGIVSRFKFISGSRYRCKECNANLQRVVPKPMNKWDATLRKLGKAIPIVSIILFVLFVIAKIVVADKNGIELHLPPLTSRSHRFMQLITLFQKGEWSNLLLIFGLAVVLMLTSYFIRKDRPRKPVFAVVPGGTGSLLRSRFDRTAQIKLSPIRYDIKIKLEAGNLKRPNDILYTYTTYTLTFDYDVQEYPVLLGVRVVQYRIMYYELSFIQSGVELPEMRVNQGFTIADQLGNSIHGTILAVYKDEM